MIARPARRRARAERRAQKKTINLGDNYYAPKTVTVAKGATVTWKWPGVRGGG